MVILVNQTLFFLKPHPKSVMRYKNRSWKVILRIIFRASKLGELSRQSVRDEIRIVEQSINFVRSFPVLFATGPRICVWAGDGMRVSQRATHIVREQANPFNLDPEVTSSSSSLDFECCFRKKMNPKKKTIEKGDFKRIFKKKYLI